MKRTTFLYIFLIAGIIIVLVIYMIYMPLFAKNVIAEDGHKVIFIPSGSSYEQVVDSLNSHLRIRNLNLLDRVASLKNYKNNINPGRYVIKKNLSYIGLINLLRSGNQSPVRLTFNNIRSLNQLAGKIGKVVEADSSGIINFLSDESNYISDGFTKENIISVFIPDTYELYWNTDAKGLYNRMLKEYRLFWNDQRLARAKEKGLAPREVAILASIIDDEVAKSDEKPRIAGVYLNRIKKGIPLQACPTIKFALNDFTITRVLNKHLLIDSPYNTYKHNGFPPGPISCPSVEGIDAVLNAEQHDYLFFAAKADFSGYHNFSKSLAEHNRYAAAYQRELNKRRIFQ